MKEFRREELQDLDLVVLNGDIEALDDKLNSARSDSLIIAPGLWIRIRIHFPFRTRVRIRIEKNGLIETVTQDFNIFVNSPSH